MRDLPSTPAVNFADLVKTLGPGRKGDLRSGGDGRVTRLVCGGIEDRYGHPLMASLPPVLHIKASDNRTPLWVQSTAKQVLAELDGAAPDVADQALRKLHAEQPVTFQALTAVITGAWLLTPTVRERIGYPGQRRDPARFDEAADQLSDGILDPVIARGPIYTSDRTD